MEKNIFAAELATRFNGTVVGVEKNNGVLRTGITLPEEKIGESVFHKVIYIDGLYESATVEEAETQIRRNSQELADNEDNLVNLAWLRDWEQVMPRIRGELINRQMNSNADEYPGIDVDDFRLVFSISIAENMKTRVTNQLLQAYGITVEELAAAAKENFSPASFTLRDFAMMFMMRQGKDLDDCPIELVAYTNRDMAYGAAGVIFDAFGWEEDMILIPSSVHEWIGFPARQADEDMISSLSSLIHQVNGDKNVINPEEILGEKPYRFSAKTRTIAAA